MKHRLSDCPYNTGESEWYLSDTNCLWCLQQTIHFHEKEYRTSPENAMEYLIEDLQD